jgi:integrase
LNANRKEKRNLETTPYSSQQMAKQGQFDLVDFLLRGGGVNQRHQNPALQKRVDVPRAYWYCRPVVPIKTETGIIRKQRRIQLGFCDEVSKKQALTALREVMATINSGKGLLQSQIVFGRIIDKFEEGGLPLLASSTQGKYGHYLAKIRTAFGKQQAHAVDTQSIQILINSSGLGWWARQDLRNCLSAVFTYAADLGLWSEPNPCAKVKVGRKSTAREKRIPRGDQLTAFLDAIHDTKICTAAVARTMALVAVVGGLRVSEVLGLQTRDLDPEAGTISIRRRWHRGDCAQPKSEASRRVKHIGPLAAELARLTAGKAPTAFIFTRDGVPFDDRDLQQHIWKPAARKAQCDHPGFGMHSLRRLHITWLQHVGASTLEAMRSAGHTSASMTWAYTVSDSQREQEQVARLWDRVQGK